MRRREGGKAVAWAECFGASVFSSGCGQVRVQEREGVPVSLCRWKVRITFDEDVVLQPSGQACSEANLLLFFCMSPSLSGCGHYETRARRLRLQVTLFDGVNSTSFGLGSGAVPCWELK